MFYYVRRAAQRYNLGPIEKRLQTSGTVEYYIGREEDPSGYKAITSTTVAKDFVWMRTRFGLAQVKAVDVQVNYLGTPAVGIPESSMVLLGQSDPIPSGWESVDSFVAGPVTFRIIKRSQGPIIVQPEPEPEPDLSTPATFNMEWWQPDIAYTGTTTSVTGVPNQKQAGIPLTYQGNALATYSNSSIQLPNANSAQRLIADELASGINKSDNAPFTLGIVFSLTPEAPTATLWSTASFGPSPTRIHIDVSSGFVRLFSQSTADVSGNVTTAANVLAGSGLQSLLVVARGNGTVSLWLNGVLVEDDLPWVRGAMADLDQFGFASLRQANSNARATQGAYKAAVWLPMAVTNEQAASLSAYLERTKNA